MLRASALAIVVVVAALGGALRGRLPDPRAAGYAGVFFLSLISSASILVPIPGLVAVCAGGVLLMPLLVGAVAGIAEAMGEVTGYLAGVSGRGLVEQNKTYARVAPWVRRWGWIVVLLAASFPNLLFDVVGAAAGAARVRFWQFFVAAWVGKTIKSVGVAYACSMGADIVRILTQRGP